MTAPAAGSAGAAAPGSRTAKLRGSTVATSMPRSRTWMSRSSALNLNRTPATASSACMKVSRPPE